MSKEIEQVNDEQQKKLNAVVDDSVDIVYVRGKKVRVKWMRNYAIRKVTDILLGDHGHENMVNCKCAAAMVLNGYWSIKLCWWLLWRWYYYVKQYRDSELSELIEVGKKKVDVESYYLTTTYLTAMKDTMMAMTRKEVERFLAAQRGEQ